MFLHFSFLKHTMAFLEIAFNTGGVQCFCIFFLKQTMAFLGVAFNKGGVQCVCISSVFKHTMSFLEIAFNTGGPTCLLFLNCQCGVWKHITLCAPTFFFFNCQCGVWKNATRCDPNQCQNVEEPVLACSNVILNATIFNCDLLESPESPTISTISGRSFRKQSWEKTCKIRWRSPMTFRRDFFDPIFPQLSDPTSTM